MTIPSAPCKSATACISCADSDHRPPALFAGCFPSASHPHAPCRPSDTLHASALHPAAPPRRHRICGRPRMPQAAHRMGTFRLFSLRPLHGRRGPSPCPGGCNVFSHRSSLSQPGHITTFTARRRQALPRPASVPNPEADRFSPMHGRSPAPVRWWAGHTRTCPSLCGGRCFRPQERFASPPAGPGLCQNENPMEHCRDTCRSSSSRRTSPPLASRARKDTSACERVVSRRP